MKRLVSALLLLALILALAGCGSPAAGGAADAPETDLSEEILSGLDEIKESEPAAEPEPEPEPEAPAADMAIRFETTALDGAAVNESVLTGASLTMVNFFEPWCPPCVGELPELEKLYETYADRGFQILGVFSDEEGVEKVLSDAGVSYPVLRYVPVFDQFQTGYVPTTIFLNAAGEVVGETVIGSRSYADWEAVILPLLG